MSPIMVTLTSHNDSNFERWNISFKENKPDGVDPKSNGFYYYVRKKEGTALRFSADCITEKNFFCPAVTLSANDRYLRRRGPLL